MQMSPIESYFDKDKSHIVKASAKTPKKIPTY